MKDREGAIEAVKRYPFHDPVLTGRTSAASRSRSSSRTIPSAERIPSKITTYSVLVVTTVARRATSPGNAEHLAAVLVS